ncbi:NAD-dependent epimerase/dehydratase family protein [Aliihoeflea aestuarii]|nr:NAD-dependent epimerase/dehydratase family protein [Aliihoeflea aestuarii]
MLENKRVFITGGAGFIGSQTTKRLFDANEVCLYDNLSRNAMQHTLKGDDSKFRFVQGSVTDEKALSTAIAEFRPTHIVHCAAVAGIETVVKRPVSTVEINMLGTTYVLKAAAEVEGVERVVTFSTSEVFGPNAYNADENTSAVIGAVGEPRWTYAVSKLVGEHLTLAYHKQFGLPSVVLRPFNVYGPGQVGEGALSIFIQRALRGETIQIHGDGSQIRAWTYVDDMVQAVLTGLEHPGAVGKAFNVGNPRAVTTIYGLAKDVVRVLGSSSKIEFIEKTYADIELRVPDAAWPKTQIGFEAQVDLEDGIQRTAEYYRALQAA